MRILCLSVVLALLSYLSFSQTVIPGGDVYGIWDIVGSPYEVMGDISIPDLETLEIDPGVTVEFQGHHALYVNGRLLAIGSEADSIIFTVNDTTGFSDPDTTLGGWYGIKIADTPEQNDTSKLMYCKLQYGKAIGPGWWLNAGGAVCIINFDKVIISNCLITHNIAGGSESEVPSGGGIHLAWADVIITDNTISNNRAVAGGAIQIHDSQPMFSNNIFRNNYAHEGGGISTGEIANITFDGDSFINNIAIGHGGGIMVWNPENWIFNNVTFSGNEAIWGAGLGLSGGNVLINNCIFQHNKAHGIGGGIAADFCELTISNTVFANDSSLSLSGAIHNWHCTTEIDNCNFYNNYAVFGGAIFSDFSSVEVDKSSFTGNSAESGGALRFWCSTLEVDSTSFLENHAYNQGGAIEFIVDTNELSGLYNFKLEYSQLKENTADYRCGAILLDQYNADASLVNVSINKCEISGNHAERIGALRIIGNITDVSVSNSKFIDNSSDLWTGCMTISNGSKGDLSNCLFAFNSAGSGSSGAAGSSNGGNVNYINCTFVGNSGITGGGIGLRNNSTANVLNSIFWGNSPNQFSLAAINDSTPCKLYVNYSDIQDGQDSISINDTVSIVHWGLNNIDQQPMFEDILNEVFTLGSSSPCIGTGIDSIQVENEWFYCPETDIVGNPRPNPSWTNPDMGAYESILPDTISSRDNLIVETHTGIKCSPNPFGTTTWIQYNLVNSSSVNIFIINHLGEIVKIVLNENLNIGFHRIKINCSDLSSGIYFMMVSTAYTTQISKMIKVD